MISKKSKLLIVLLIVSFSITIGYMITTLSVRIGVIESITINPSSVDLEIYPKQSKWATFTVSNANPDNDTDVTLLYTLEPSTTDLTITFVPNNSVNVPASGSVEVKVRIQASKSIAPGTYTLWIYPDR